MGTRIKQEILKGRGTNDQSIHEKVLNFLAHKRNAYQNYMKISPHHN
jgi:hypothetical protein